MKQVWPYAAAALVGVGIWYGIIGVAGGREAWDSTLYWRVGYPAMALTACVIAVFFPQRPWRWGAVMMASHALCSLLVPGMEPNLWPLSLIMLVVLALPLIAASYAASYLGALAGAGKLK